MGYEVIVLIFEVVFFYLFLFCVCVCVCVCVRRRSIIVWTVASSPDIAVHPKTGKLCLPSSKWVPVSNQGRMRQLKERDGLRLSSAVPKIQWDSNPRCSYGYYGNPLPLP